MSFPDTFGDHYEEALTRLPQAKRFASSALSAALNFDNILGNSGGVAPL
jgi:hypothetical protein